MDLEKLEEKLHLLQTNQQALHTEIQQLQQLLQDHKKQFQSKEQLEKKTPPSSSVLQQAKKAATEEKEKRKTQDEEILGRKQPALSKGPLTKTAAKAKNQTPEKKTKHAHKNNLPKIDFAAVELRLGRVWLVRLGIISLLTGLIFLSNYAYQHYIVEWSAAPRVAGLYFLACCLLGLGHFFERKKASLKNYGRVLGAGGLSVLYYTSYAAHHMERLRVIESPFIGGIILVASALFCLGYSLRKKSETMAVFSLLLAFYATSITPVNGFTLISSTILTLIGVVLMARFKSWALGITTLLGAYGSFAYWQFIVQQDASSPLAKWFLLAYWSLATIGFFLHQAKKNTTATTLEPSNKDSHKNEKNNKETRLALWQSSLNHAAFFALFSVDRSQLFPFQPSWQFAGVFGLVLLGLSGAIQHWKTHGKELVQTHFAKAISLIALCLCLWLEGATLALSLGLQAAVLIVLGYARGSKLNQILGTLVGLLSICFYLLGWRDATPLQHGLIALLYLAAGAASAMTCGKLEKVEQHYARGITVLLFILATISWILSLKLEVGANILIILMLALLTQLPLLLAKKWQGLYCVPHCPWFSRFPELPLLGHSFTAIAIAWLFVQPTSSSWLLGAILLLVGYNALIQVRERLDSVNHFAHHVYLVLFTFIYLFWCQSLPKIEWSLLGFTGLGLVYHLSYQRSKLPSFIGVIVLYYLLSLGAYYIWVIEDSLSYSLSQTQAWVALPLALAPVLHSALIRKKILTWIPCINDFLIAIAGMKILLFAALFLKNPQVVIAILGIFCIAIEQRKRISALTVVAALYFLISALSFIDCHLSYIEMYLISLAPVIAYFVVRQHPQRAYQRGFLWLFGIGGALLIWQVASQQTIVEVGRGALSICWAVLGFSFLMLGLRTKANTLRTMGFVILTFCVLRVYVVDVWKLSAVLRILSFIILGVVLMVGGYFYCKVPEMKKQPKGEQDKGDNNEEKNEKSDQKEDEK